MTLTHTFVYLFPLDMKDIVLDVREIDKKFRKKTILNFFDELSEDQNLMLISSHSLAPLHKVFLKERNGFFCWANLESGPELWKINITKINSLNLTIGDILGKFPASKGVFEEHHIPYFSLGDCQMREVGNNAGMVFEEIRARKPKDYIPLRTDHWSITFTIDYIIQNHHLYVKETIPEIYSLIEHLSLAHASSQPQLPMIQERFLEFSRELTDHMKDEEEVVFPSFKKLEESNDSVASEEDQSLVDAISWIEEDHVLSGSNLKLLRKFCNNYKAPEESSPGFKILYEELIKFESDLHFHMHLENNVLFSKVMKLIQS